MNTYLESLVSGKTLLSFEIGQALNFSRFENGKDYERISDSDGYTFYNKDLQVEVTLTEGRIHSFDILLHHQDSELFMGEKNGENINLSNCTVESFTAYLNTRHLEWNFAGFIGGKCVYIEYRTSVKWTFYFDFEESPSKLSLINVSR
jgi:hypothetical protein